jgi:poly-gamma-glutamate biosynthesis protein PgsC/CapC
MVVETIGLGMLVSFFLTETVGLAAGGIVVPGYFALTLTEPVRVVATILVALVTFLIIKLLSQVMLVFGRRMLLLGVLVGYLLGYVTKIVPTLTIATLHLDVSVVGYVIPGLLAYCRMDGKNGDKEIRDLKESQTAWNAENVALGQQHVECRGPYRHRIALAEQPG